MGSLLIRSLAIGLDFGPMPPCLARAATEVVTPGGNNTLASMSTGSYFAWPPGGTPLQIENATLGAMEAYPMAVLMGIGPPSRRYVALSEAIVSTQ